MSDAVISLSSFNGTVAAPPSKSAAHRALICSFLAGGGTVEPIIDSNDMRATTGVINAIKNNETVLNCLESGSTLRFMIPVAAALGKSVTFVGEGRLPQRPIGEYLKLLPMHNVNVKSDGGLPLEISGKLTNGTYELNGDISSQYVTGLLMALAVADGDSAVVIKTPLRSKPYVDMTVKVMRDYGVNVFETDFGYLVHGGQNFGKIDYHIEGDWSQAAFFLAAGALNGDVTVSSLDANSTQGDKKIVDILRDFGAELVVKNNSVRCVKSDLHSVNINAEDIPDLVPILAVVAAFAKGVTVISGAKRLRYKESDRLKSVADNLERLGADVRQTEDGLIINGGAKLKSAKLKGYNDHRIVMAFSIAASMLDGDTVIDDAFSVNKSYPSFFDDYNSIGGRANVI